MTSAGRIPSIQEGWQQRQATDTVLPTAVPPPGPCRGVGGLSAPCQAVLDAPGGIKSTATTCTQSSVCTTGLGSDLAKSLDTPYIIRNGVGSTGRVRTMCCSTAELQMLQNLFLD